MRLLANGVMDVARLYESPTDHIPYRPDMILTYLQVDEIVNILHDVRHHAGPDETVA